MSPSVNAETPTGEPIPLPEEDDAIQPTVAPGGEEEGGDQETLDPLTDAVPATQGPAAHASAVDQEDSSVTTPVAAPATLTPEEHSGSAAAVVTAAEEAIELQPPSPTEDTEQREEDEPEVDADATDDVVDDVANDLAIAQAAAQEDDEPSSPYIPPEDDKILPPVHIPLGGIPEGHPNKFQGEFAEPQTRDQAELQSSYSRQNGYVSWR